MSVISNILLLVIEGSALAALLLPSGTWLLPLGLSLPLSAFTNVLLVALYTLTGVALTQTSLLGGHCVILVILIAIIYKKPKLLLNQERPIHTSSAHTEKFITWLSLLLISITLVYSFVHAVLLPTNQYDSVTNWTMRSEISFYDHAIAFDSDDSRGMMKPQYPFLFHALQITVNQSLPRWSDTAGNSILFLLSLCSFGALFSLLRRLRGMTHAIVTIALITGIPLLSVHLAQGYADINLVQYVLLSFICVAMWIESTAERRGRWLLLSGIFAAASVWTKSEGLLFGLVPWLLVVALLCGRQKKSWLSVRLPLAVAIILSSLWPIFATLRHLSLTPHSSDSLIAFHPEGVYEAFVGLFSRGSFGITWYLLSALLVAIAIAALQKSRYIVRSQLPLIAAGVAMFIGFLFVYLCTPNVQFLLKAESYYRQMMLPAALLLLGCSLSIRLRE